MGEFIEMLENILYDRFATANMSASVMLVELLLALIAGMYIFFVYRIVTRRSVYVRSFHISLPIITVITCTIIMTLQCSILVTLGALGALSIIRFRTAIKDPMDLVFIFWSIVEGIVCGADLVKLAVCSIIVITLLIVFLELMPIVWSPLYLILNVDEVDHEGEVVKAIADNTRRYRVKSRNVNPNGMDMVVEVEPREESKLVSAVSKLESVRSTSLISHDGDVNF